MKANGLYSPEMLHIPDGFLSLSIALIFWVLTAACIALAVRRTRDELGDRQIPLMGVMAAFIFAAQMINFPIAGGTSGHLLGGALTAIVLGPWTGMLVMTTVVGVQALFFQDGGLVVMGANIFNMGILTTLIGYGLFRGVQDRARWLQFTAAGTAAWLSVLAGALATALQLWLSGTSTLSVVLPAMLGVHALIGAGETLITVAALTFLYRTRPDLLSGGQETRGRGWIVVGGLISLAVVLISPLASASPDGLERVAIDLGFIGRGTAAPYQILPGYTLPFFGDSSLSTIGAGVLGLLLVAGVMFLILKPMKNTSQKEP